MQLFYCLFVVLPSCLHEVKDPKTCKHHEKRFQYIVSVHNIMSFSMWTADLANGRYDIGGKHILNYNLLPLNLN